MHSSHTNACDGGAPTTAESESVAMEGMLQPEPEAPILGGPALSTRAHTRSEARERSSTEPPALLLLSWSRFAPSGLVCTPRFLARGRAQRAVAGL